jgi:asparagine synthase (glutamine-hydrolysing)
VCGIAGILAPSRANPSAVRAMTDLLAYRGPDGDGLWVSPDGRCVLGHRRLAIIDLSEGGRQPMLDRARGLAITYNGEIYNYVELRERLRGLGYAFHSTSDTEVLLAAYAVWGPDCLQHLNGMFAFAIWDANRRTLFCARDRFGEKPFHYSVLPHGFAFASEAKALALLEGVDTAIDDGVLAGYVDDGSTRIDASDRTLVRGVRQLLPAHAIEVRLDERSARIARTWRYWSVDLRARAAYGSADLGGAARQLAELLRDSVRIRLRSDVPVGSCLSGGLDSSTVVSLMRRLEPAADLRTFTGRFPGDPLDEGHYAKLVVDASRTQAFETAPTAERFLADAARVYWHADFPIGGMSQFAQWCVFHLASRHGVIVLLDGQGSDEVLGGYGSSIIRAFLDQLWAEKRLSAWRGERRAAARSDPALFSWPRLALAHPALAPVRAGLRRITGRSQWTRADLFRRDWLAEARRARSAPDPEEALDARHGLSRILWTLSFRTMLSSLLRFGDRLSMAHSREVRLPFCDHRIAEFVFGLPPEFLVGDGQVKRVLREAIRGLVPDALVSRPKQGFIPPQDAWLAGPLDPWVREIGAEPGPIGELLDRDASTALARADGATRRRELDTSWHLANLAAWSRYALAPMQSAGSHAIALAGDVQIGDSAQHFGTA